MSPGRQGPLPDSGCRARGSRRVLGERELTVDRRGRLNVKPIASQPCSKSYAHPSLPARQMTDDQAPERPGAC